MQILQQQKVQLIDHQVKPKTRWRKFLTIKNDCKTFLAHSMLIENVMMSGESSGILGNFLSLNSIAILNFSSIMSMCFYPTIQRVREKDERAEKFSCSHSQNIVKVKWLKLKNFVNLQNTWKKKFHFVLFLGIFSFLTPHSTDVQ